MRRASTRARALAVAAGMAILSLGAAACGSDDDTSSQSATSSGVTVAASSDVSPDVAATIEEFSGPVDWPGPDEKFTPVEGKRLTIIICGSQGITCVRGGNGARDAAEALGYEAKVVDGRSQPTVWNQAIQAAITDKVDGIVLVAVPPALVTGALKQAKEANIPVASVLSVLGPPTDVRVNYDRADVARANAAFIAQDSGGKAKVLITRDKAFAETLPTLEAYPDALAQACKDCTVADTIDFSIALASQRLAGDIAQALRSDPEITYILSPFDGIVPFLSQGIRQAGRQGKVKIVGIGADPPSIEAIKSGDEVMSLGTPAEWMGWDGVDGLARIFADVEVPELHPDVPGGATNYVVPERYITKDNLPGPEGWMGGFDYEAKFKELWGK